MNQQKLTELLLLQNKEIASATPFCPEGHEIATLFESSPNKPDYDRFENHMADCSYCQARATVVARLYRNTDDEQLPEALLAVASQFGNQDRRNRWRRTPAWAVAAIVIISFFAVINQNPSSTSGPIEQMLHSGETGEQISLLRNIGRVESGPTVLSPDDGERIGTEELTIRWTQVPGSLYYDVRLVSAEGFMIWQERVRETSSSPPPDLELVSGNRYFVRVDAYLAEGKSVGSPHVQFTIETDN